MGKSVWLNFVESFKSDKLAMFFSMQNNIKFSTSYSLGIKSKLLFFLFALLRLFFLVKMEKLHIK